MWEQIKQAFLGNKGPSVKIQPIAHEDGLLLFRAAQKLKLGKQTLLAPAKRGDLAIDVEIVAFHPEENLYRAKIEDEVFALDAMQLERRGEFRLTKRIRVSSRELSGKEARTEDISLTGARLTLPKFLKAGDQLNVKLHFGDPGVPDLDVFGEVSWCGLGAAGDFHAGLRFSKIEKTERANIKRFIQNQVAMGAKI